MQRVKRVVFGLSASLAGLAVANPLPAAESGVGVVTAPHKAHRPAGETLVLVGHVDPSGPIGQWVGLAGGWSSSRGWIKPPESLLPPDWTTPPGWSIPARWKATSWQLFSDLSSGSRIIRTQPMPDPSQDEVLYKMTAPAPTGVALAGAIRPLPRRARQQHPMRPELHASTRRLLVENGVPAPARPRILESYRVDLNGDGVEEVLWTARSRETWNSPYEDRPEGPRTGDYALLGIRYLTKSGVRSETLTFATAGHDSDRYRLMTPVDINGDGRLEIVAHRRGFEDDELLVFTFDGQRVSRVLEP